jgi:hypothetical protein
MKQGTELVRNRTNICLPCFHLFEVLFSTLATFFFSFHHASNFLCSVRIATREIVVETKGGVPVETYGLLDGTFKT